MPFTDRNGNELRDLPLIYRMGQDFQVVEAFCWRDPREGRPVLEIPAHDPTLPPTDGNRTDFASVPPFLWGLVASFGKQTLPAILHDSLTYKARLAPADQRLAMRRVADEIFRVALVDAGVHQLRARVMWAAVGIERYARHAGARGAAIIAQLSLGILTIYAALAVGAFVHPLLLLLIAAPFVAAIVWGHDADLVVTSTYLGALYTPLIAAAFIGSRLEQFLALVIWVGSGTPGPLPKAEPTLRWPDHGSTLPPR